MHAHTGTIGLQAGEHVSSEVYDFWDQGRVIGKLERFLSMTGKPSSPDVDRVALCHQHFPKAVEAAYKRLFRGYSIGPDVRLSPDDVQNIMRGITQTDAIEYAFLGIINPGSVYRYDRKGNLEPYKPPMNQPGRFWRMVMERLGLAGKRTVNGTTGLQDFELKTGSWQAIATAAEQRRSNRNSIINIRDKGISVAGIEEPSGMELLTQIADRFRGLKCSTRASVMIAGQEIILPVPDCVAATNPREIVLDGVPVMWPWDWDVSEELLEMARWDERSFLHNMGSGIGLLRVKSGLEDQVVEIIRQLRNAA